MRLSAVWTLLWALAASPAAAEQQITPDAFLDIAEGRTLTFSSRVTGQVVGVEQFLRRDLSVWTQTNGRCAYGRIEIRGPQLCFIYQDFPEPDNCWLPFDDGGTLLVLSTRSGEMQQITDVSKDELSCQGAPIS